MVPRPIPSADAKASRAAAQKRIERILGALRKQGRLPWNAVLDLTRDLDQWQVYGSPRDARAAMCRRYTEDRWLGQPAYPVLIVEKDTLEPVCKPMAQAWQMPFASSRGYSSLTLQHDAAEILRDRHARTGQSAIVYFVSDLDPSGLDLQRAWQDAFRDFGARVLRFVRLGLTREQVDNPDLDIARLGIGVKPSDSRSTVFVREFGRICWEADILPAAEIEAALDEQINSWLHGIYGTGARRKSRRRGDCFEDNKKRNAARLAASGRTLEWPLKSIEQQRGTEYALGRWFY